MTRNCCKVFVLSLVLLSGFFSAAFSYAEVVIINSQNPLTSVDRNELRAIFSMQHTQWKDGSLIKVFVYEDRYPIHQKFCKNVLEIFPYQLRKNWDRLIYSGTGKAPALVKNKEEMLRVIAATPGAIGYIDERGTGHGVKTVPVEK